MAKYKRQKQKQLNFNFLTSGSANNPFFNTNSKFRANKLSSPFLIKPNSGAKKNLRWTQAVNRFPNLKPFGDNDRDGVLNMFDCFPFDRNRQDELVQLKSALKGGLKVEKKEMDKLKMETISQKKKRGKVIPKIKSTLGRLESRYKRIQQLTRAYPHSKDMEIRALQKEYREKVLRPQEEKVKKILVEQYKKEVSPTYRAIRKVKGMGKKVSKAISRKYTPESRMKQKAISSRIRKTVGVLTNVSEASLSAAIGGEAFGTGGTVVKGRGRPKGTVQYRDDYGNPIGVYEWRKLQRLKAKRIRLQIAQAEAARAQAMEQIQARGGATPRELLQSIPDASDTMVAEEDGQVVDAQPTGPMPKMPGAKDIQAQAQIQQMQQMTPEQMVYIQQMRAKQQASYDRPYIARSAEDAAVNPYGLKAKYKMNFNDNHILRADKGGNILHTPNNILNAPNVFSSAQEQKRLVEMESFNQQPDAQAERPSKQMSENRGKTLVKIKGGGYIYV